MNRTLKRLLVRSCNPIDAVARRINGKQHYPPLDLRWEVGPLRGFETSGAESRLFLRLFAGLRPQSSILDIGCGCGQTALFLAEDLDATGRYEGWDIFSRAIHWCNNRIAANDPRFTFRHLDIANGMYNPAGSASAATVSFPAIRPFDVILLKSVFTHMLPGEIENYLRQIPKLLAPGGRCLATFFLLNAVQKSLAASGLNRIKFVPHVSGAFVANPHVPEAIVAYEESVLCGMLQKAGLALARPPLYGSWTGNRECLSHQDMLVLETAP